MNPYHPNEIGHFAVVVVVAAAVDVAAEPAVDGAAAEPVAIAVVALTDAAIAVVDMRCLDVGTSRHCCECPLPGRNVLSCFPSP